MERDRYKEASSSQASASVQNTSRYSFRVFTAFSSSPRPLATQQRRFHAPCGETKKNNNNEKKKEEEVSTGALGSCCC